MELALVDCGLAAVDCRRLRHDLSGFGFDFFSFLITHPFSYKSKKTRTKRIAEETLLQESFKKLRTAKASRPEPIQEQPTEEPKGLSEEELKKMLEIVPVEEIKAEALQVKEDPVILWILVKERFSSAKPTEDMERALMLILKRNFVPTSVVTKSGQVPFNTAKQSSPRAAASISTARPINTAAPKSKVNDALPKTYSYFKAHSPVRRAFNQKLAAKTNNLNEKVKTTRVNNVTTAGSKAVVNAAVGNGENAIKSSTCWIWRPT
ncbi:hypothetical protein Tco_0694846 [Tanacetum coccineum]